MMTDVLKKKPYVTIGAFCVVALAMILIGVFALGTPVVAMCALVIIEAAIAVMLHNAELWVHGILVLAEVIAGILSGRIVLIILCAVMYVASIFALQMLDQES